MSWFPRLAALLLAAMFCCASLAQADSEQVAPTIAALRTELEKMPKTVESSEDVSALVAQINALTATTEKFIASRTSELNDLNARLGELGPAPAGGAAAETPDITKRRATLTKERNTVDADIRLAR